MQTNSNPIETLSIETQSRNYPLFLGEGAIENINSYIKENLPKTTKIVVITDENVKQHFSIVVSALKDYSPLLKVVPVGEKAKSFDVYYDCLTFALENRLDRHSLILAFGGGAVGDLAGFVASSYMRGIPFIQIPTTILAHDSAIGGKVAINHELGKNLIGAFYQPYAVFYDLQFLQTLSKVEKLSGFAEVIKEALISDVQFYNWLRNNIFDIESLSLAQLQYILKKGMQVKQKIVSEDETEQGIRAFLNFGHTMGHAIEANLGYGKWTHGQAVTIGMLYALKFSKHLLNLSFNTEEFEEWLNELGFYVEIPPQLKKDELIEKMFLDKKATGSIVNYVLLEQIGKPIIYPLEKEQIEKLV